MCKYICMYSISFQERNYLFSNDDHEGPIKIDYSSTLHSIIL